MFHIINEETRQRVENPVIRALREGIIVGLTNYCVLIAKDGMERPIDDSASPIRDKRGRVSGVVLIFRDISERRAAEKALQDADRRKDEFLAMLAHELRNPLAPIRNGLHILQMPNVDGPTTEWVKVVMEQQVRNLTRMVDDLLDVSRITRGKIQLREETVELASAVRHAIEQVRQFIEGQRVELSVSLPSQAVLLKGDPTRLEQIVVNLLNNAAKYTEAGGHIFVTGQRDGDEAVLRVRDTGIGIPPDLLPHIFDMFTQADHSLAHSQDGLGVGLTLVRQLVELHGGVITAHSAGSGQGSEFVVRLPAISESVSQPIARRMKSQDPRHRAVRVLVVEDERAVAEVLVRLLSLWGHAVEHVDDGPAALAAVSTLRPEVILCDIGLPGMDGYRVARHLCQHAVETKPLLVAVTGYGREEDRRRAAEAGFDHHMTKPVDPNDRLRDVLRNRFGCDESEAENRIAAFEKDVRYSGAVK